MLVQFPSRLGRQPWQVLPPFAHKQFLQRPERLHLQQDISDVACYTVLFSSHDKTISTDFLSSHNILDPKFKGYCVDINCFSWSSMVGVNKSLVGLELGARVLQSKSPSNRHALFVSEQTLDNIDSK